MNDDIELLREYASRHSEPAFEGLVARHVSLVHSAALRQVRDPHLAEEIAQTVFIILARKAGSLGPKTILPGWLYRTTRYVSAAALKIQRRRERREQEAHMLYTTDETQADEVWEEVSPLLDEAMAQLRDTDRDALVLRYFKNKSLREVGAAFGQDEYAAQKRVSRALDKLRGIFLKRGMVSTAAMIAGAISANSIQAAPALLAKSIAAVAMTKGIAASGSTLTLIKGALKLMAWTKGKTAVVVTAILVAATSGTLITSGVFTHNEAAGIALLKRLEQRYATLESYSYSGTGITYDDSKTNITTFAVRLARPCNYLTELHTTGTETFESMYWTVDDYAMSYSSWQTNRLHKIKATHGERLSHFGNLDFETLPDCIPTHFFFCARSTSPLGIFSETNNSLNVTLEANGKIGGRNCKRLTISARSRPSQYTLWIGESDLLIHKVELRFEGAKSKPLPFSYSARHTENYNNIVVDPPFSRDDFVPKDIPMNLKASEKFP